MSSMPPSLIPSLIFNSSIESSSALPAQPPLDASIIVLLTVLCLIILLVAGLVFFSRWDALDRKILLYVPKRKRASHSCTRSFAELAAFRRGIDNAFLAGSVPNTALEDVEDVEYDLRSRWIRSTQQALRCCMSKPEEFSILIAGNMFPRLLDALRRYHPWVWFFSEGSRKSTRVIRFVITFKFLLTSLFVTTVLYDINYPSAETCANLNHQPSTCLKSRANVLTGKPTCEYNYSSNHCTVRPPPGNVAFLILVAFLTVLVMAPFNAIFTLVLTHLCSKRPRVEALGLNALEWLGSADPATSKQAMDAAEESKRILAVVRSVQGALYHYSERKAEGFCGLDETKGMDFVLQKLGLVIRGNRIELAIYSRLWFTDVNHAIRYHVERSHEHAREIQLNMEQYSEVSQKESYLVQYFLINRFSLLFRTSLSRYFAHRARDVPQIIHPIIWILAWFFIIISLLFFIGWILWWGNTHDRSITISNWGVNFALINFQEVFIFSVARIFFVNVLAIETIRPQLKIMHEYLIAKAEARSKRGAMTTETRGRDCNKSFLFQCLDPLFLAAKLSGSSNFATVPDSDLLMISNGTPIAVEDEVREEEGKFSSVVRIEPGREF